MADVNDVLSCLFTRQRDNSRGTCSSMSAVHLQTERPKCSKCAYLSAPIIDRFFFFIGHARALMNVIGVNISVKYEVNRTVRGSQCCIGDEYNSCGEGAVEEGRQSKGWAHARPRNMIYAARRHPKSRATTRTRCSAGTKFFMCCSTRSALCGSNEKITKTCCVCVC